MTNLVKFKTYSQSKYEKGYFREKATAKFVPCISLEKILTEILASIFWLTEKNIYLHICYAPTEDIITSSTLERGVKAQHVEHSGGNIARLFYTSETL